MATNLNINEKLLEEAKRLGGHRTKRDTVDEALREYVNRRKRVQVIDEFNSFDFDPEYHYKEERD